MCTKQLTVGREPCKLAALLYTDITMRMKIMSLDSIDRRSIVAFSTDSLARRASAYLPIKTCLSSSGWPTQSSRLMEPRWHSHA